MASERGPWIEKEFTEEGESYIVNDGYVEGFRASITLREGFFDVEVYKHEYEYERDDNIGIYVQGHREEYLNSRELTVDNIRTAVRDFVTIPDSLANELSEWQEQYWASNEIEKAYVPEHADEINKIAEELKGVLTKVIYNDMSAADAEERWVGTTELAQETLSRADLVGNEDKPKIRGMVQALRDIADVNRAKEPHVIAGEALAEVGEMSTPGRVERVVLNQSPDDRFPTLDTYEDALEQMEAAGIAGMQRKIDARETSLRSALEDIRRLGGNRTDEQVFADTVMVARLTLSEHERDLHSSSHTLDIQVMHLALRTIAISDESYAYAQSDSVVNPGVVDRAVESFKGGVKLLIDWDKQGMSVGGESVDGLAKVVHDAGSLTSLTYAELGARTSAIAGAAIDELKSMRHSIDERVSLDQQQINGVRQGNPGVGISL